MAKLNKLLNDDEDDDADNSDGHLNWSQYKSLVPDLIYLYVVVGKHYKKTQMVLVYFRNLIHFGDFKCFTYDSIIMGDHEIRARHQGLDSCGESTPTRSTHGSFLTLSLSTLLAVKTLVQELYHLHQVQEQEDLVIDGFRENVVSSKNASLVTDVPAAKAKNTSWRNVKDVPFT